MRLYFVFFGLHWFLIGFLLAIPLVIGWRYLILIFLVYLAFRIIVDRQRDGYTCPVSYWQFGSKKSFLQHYFAKIGLRLSKKFMKFGFGYGLPFLLLLTAFLVQFVAGVTPLFIR